MLLLGIAVEAFLIYLTVNMSRKKNDKKMSKSDRKAAKKKMILYSVLIGIFALILVMMTYDHFKHVPKKASLQFM